MFPEDEWVFDESHETQQLAENLCGHFADKQCISNPGNIQCIAQNNFITMLCLL